MLSCWQGPHVRYPVLRGSIIVLEREVKLNEVQNLSMALAQNGWSFMSKMEPFTNLGGDFKLKLLHKVCNCTHQIHYY